MTTEPTPRHLAARRVAELMKQLFVPDPTRAGMLTAGDAADAPILEDLVALGHELLARADGAVDFLYQPEYETLQVEGVSYAYDLFRGLGMNGLAVGTVVEIMKRENGLVWLRAVKPCVGVCETVAVCEECGEDKS